MKYCGKVVSGDYSRVVAMGRPDGSSWEVCVRPLRLSFHRVLRERGVMMPQPPTRVSRDSQGRVIRDADGVAVLQRDESDAGYLAAVEKYHQRVATLIVWESLREDSRFEFEVKEPAEGGDWGAFADALYVELEEAGWTAGDVIWFCEQVAELSQLSAGHVREARADFF
ncbi:hypothetical protein [Rubinisphaera margarita]|uniref:hypothetical protein n=1 Tax=Rubinisphaera margarita TaxID=2909586 RepID=UPI001EE94425|nr:hypothetical protein [Rubinisphaera margarita]MCG6154895.1 hypothetical protein [Rubinisphaera margarita]